jgi:hypothetical protein
MTGHCDEAAAAPMMGLACPPVRLSRSGTLRALIAGLAALLLPATLLLIAGCSNLPESGAKGTGRLIPEETVNSLGAPTCTREDWVTQLGEPTFSGDRFFAYQRGAPFRNVWQSPRAAGATTVAVGAERDSIFFYQLIGVWLGPSGHVLQTRQFIAPCGSCAEGQVLLSDAEIGEWMRSESPKRH